jgi:ubiquitin C-terminal hydrolase
MLEPDPAHINEIDATFLSEAMSSIIRKPGRLQLTALIREIRRRTTGHEKMSDQQIAHAVEKLLKMFPDKSPALTPFLKWKEYSADHPGIREIYDIVAEKLSSEKTGSGGFIRFIKKKFDAIAAFFTARDSRLNKLGTIEGICLDLLFTIESTPDDKQKGRVKHRLNVILDHVKNDPDFKEIKGHLEGIKRYINEHYADIVDIIDEKPSLEFLTKIPGIRNPACLCYCNSALVALFASSKFLERIMTIPKPVDKAISYLQDVFDDLQKPGKALSHMWSGALNRFNTACRSFFPGIRRWWIQRDSAEFIQPIIEPVLQDPSTSIICSKMRPMLDMERAQEAREKTNEAPPLEAMRMGPIDIPYQEPCMPQLKIPHREEPVSIQTFFDGFTKQEAVEIDALLGDDENKKWLTADQKEALKKQKLPKTIQVTEQLTIKGKPPDVLPLNVARFQFGSRGRTKDFSRVQMPFTVYVSVFPDTKEEAGGPLIPRKEMYVLRSVTVHRGKTLDAGHYYTYMPDPSSVDAQGNPTLWVKASDDAYKEILPWEKVKDDIETQGTIVIYDRVHSV